MINPFLNFFYENVSKKKNQITVRSCTSYYMTKMVWFTRELVDDNSNTLCRSHATFVVRANNISQIHATFEGNMQWM